MRRNESGFTLIEMVIVILVLGIMVATVSISIADINNIKRDMAARKLVSDIRLAQNLAIGRHTNTWVAFDIAANKYTMYLENPFLLGKANRRVAKEPLSQAPFIVELGSPTDSPVMLTFVEIGGTPEVHFDKYGFPTNADDVRLTVPGTVIINSTRKLVITPETGRLLMEIVP
ncbi:MAG: prepilin-type N-terminal cleavage/methylation domain-containing protein [Planctomycetes bacterium]|nr:prepilin-type N-terminal cleavage/methylation domain-containing protein [Planctomycetota bacterium]